MKSKIPNVQENINSVSESTSTEFQKDVGDVIDNINRNSNSNSNSNIELLSYKINEQNQRIIKLEAEILEINKPLIDKLNKYKVILSIATTIILAIGGFCFKLYNNSLYKEFDNHIEKINSNSNNIQKLNDKYSELNQKIILLEYKESQKVNKSSK